MAGISSTVRVPIYDLYSKLSGPLGMVTIASVKVRRPVSRRHIELSVQLVLLPHTLLNNRN